MPRNAYAGTCYRCGEVVSPGAGHFERYQGAWRVQHDGCAIAYRGTSRETTGPRVSRDDLWIKRRVNCGDCNRPGTTRKPKKNCQTWRCSSCLAKRRKTKVDK